MNTNSVCVRFIADYQHLHTTAAEPDKYAFTSVCCDLSVVLWNKTQVFLLQLHYHIYKMSVNMRIALI